MNWFINTLMMSLLIISSNGLLELEDYNYLHLANCECVPENMCQDNVAAINGNGLLDIRYVKRPCENYYEVCCENPIKEIKRRPLLPSDIHSASSFKDCGYGNSDSFGYRITDESTNAHFAELPWTIVVLHKSLSTDKNTYKCGGSLIHQQVVLTAAHCVNDYGAGQWTARAGEWNTKEQDEPLPHQDRTVKEFAIHPGYNPGSLKNDIALLFLNEPFKPADNVRLICLPTFKVSIDKARCIVSGWGKNSFKKGKYSSVLRKVDVPVVPRDACLKSLRQTRLGKRYRLHQSFICAGGEMDRDACKGDGGSPLVCPIPNQEGRYFQAGIVSWGIGCGANKTPGVYVNVALYVEWIGEQLRARNVNRNIYKYRYK